MGLDFGTQAFYGVTVDAGKKSAFTPFAVGCRRLGGELAAHREPFRLQDRERRRYPAPIGKRSSQWKPT